jgi:DNA-directed RNA polymerase specialized sigma24 family protein
MCDSRRARNFLPRLAAGVRQAENDFILEFFDCAFRHSWNTLEYDERVESVHDAFMKIFESARAGMLPDLTGSYIHTSVYLQCKNRWLRNKRRPKTVALPADDRLPPTPDTAEFGWGETFTGAGLTAEEEDILRLRFIHRCTIEEIVQKVGRPRATVKADYTRATEKIRRYLKD